MLEYVGKGYGQWVQGIVLYDEKGLVICCQQYGSKNYHVVC